MLFRSLVLRCRGLRAGFTEKWPMVHQKKVLLRAARSNSRPAEQQSPGRARQSKSFVGRAGIARQSKAEQEFRQSSNRPAEQGRGRVTRQGRSRPTEQEPSGRAGVARQSRSRPAGPAGKNRPAGKSRLVGKLRPAGKSHPIGKCRLQLSKIATKCTRSTPKCSKNAQ